MNAGIVLLCAFVALQASGTAAVPCRTCQACDYGDRFSHCRCDPECEEYGDCCETRDQVACASGNPPSPRRYQCVYAPDDFLDYRYLWMVLGCPDSWDTSTTLGQVVSELCWNGSQSDIPVTDADTGIIYNNTFCAMCHGVQNTSMRYWRWTLECSFDLESDLHFGSVQLSVQNLLSTDIYCFPPVIREPENVVSNLRECFTRYSPHPPCLDEATLGVSNYNELVQGCVNGYENIVQDQNNILIRYRNEFCARCNGIPENQLICSNEPFIESTLSFTLILDVNQDGLIVMTDQETYEVDVSCQTDEVFDPVTQQCRQTVESLLQSLQPTPPTITCTETLIALDQNDTFQMVNASTVLYNGVEYQIEFVNSNQEPVICVNLIVFNCVTELIALGENDTFELINNTTVLYAGQEYEIAFRNSNQQPVICVNFTMITNISIACADGEVFDTVAMRCREVEVTPTESTITTTIDCAYEVIALGQNDTFQIIDATTVLYNDEQYRILLVTPDQQLVICVDFSQNGTQIANRTVISYSYPVGISILTYVGCSLSVVGCLALLLTYACFKELRTFPSKLLMNLAIAITIADLLLIVGVPIVEIVVITELCTAVAIFLHFFFIAYFFWMTIFTFEMMRTFYNAHRMNTARPSTTLLVIYIFLGWGGPLLLVGATVIANYITASLSTFDDVVLYGVLEDGMVGSCWINHFESAIVAFVAPVGFLYLLNVLFFITIITLLCLSGCNQTRLENNKRNIPYLRVGIATMFVSGLTWGFGFLAILIGTSWSWYPYVIFNSTQGLALVLPFLCTKKVGGLYLSLCRKRGKKPVTKTTQLSAKKSIETNPVSESSNRKPVVP